NQLKGEFVRRVGPANTYAGFDVPRLAGVVDHPVGLMCLLTSGVELVEWSEIVVFLDSHRPHRRNVIGNARGWREIEILKTVIGGVENRIDDDVHRFQVPTDDRPNLGRKSRRVPMSVIKAKLKISAVEEPTVVRMRHGEQCAQLEAVH